MLTISQHISDETTAKGITAGQAKKALAGDWNVNPSSIYKWENDDKVFVMRLEDGSTIPFRKIAKDNKKVDQITH